MSSAGWARSTTTSPIVDWRGDRGDARRPEQRSAPPDRDGTGGARPGGGRCAGPGLDRRRRLLEVGVPRRLGGQSRHRRRLERRRLDRLAPGRPRRPRFARPTTTIRGRLGGGATTTTPATAPTTPTTTAPPTTLRRRRTRRRLPPPTTPTTAAADDADADRRRRRAAPLDPPPAPLDPATGRLIRRRHL